MKTSETPTHPLVRKVSLSDASSGVVVALTLRDQMMAAHPVGIRGLALLTVDSIAQVAKSLEQAHLERVVQLGEHQPESLEDMMLVAVTGLYRLARMQVAAEEAQGGEP